MSGRPDYDVGDLVVCVSDGPCALSGACVPIEKGRVYLVTLVHFYEFHASEGARWWTEVEGIWASFDGSRFAKLPPKPLEFWTGAIKADQPAKVPA